MKIDPNVTIEQLEEIELALASVLALPTRMRPSQWANAHRELSREANVTGGKWRNFPMQEEPMDAVVEPEVRSVVLMWSSQTAGKTELLLNIAGYFIHQDPSSMMMVQPTLEMGEAWSKDRFDPMVRDTPVLAECCHWSKTRKTGNTILHKTFPGGHLTIAGANSPASLASRPIRVKLFDEIDRYPVSAGREGDPIKLTEVRSDTFWNDVNFKTSTPTIRGASRIEAEWDLSDKRYWFVKCVHCEYEQRLKWAQVRIPEGREEDTTYECENGDCKAQWSDVQRVAAIWAGHWVATAPFKGIRGYHLNGIYSLFRCKKGFRNRLHQMAHQFLEAKKLGDETYKVWVNTFLAETWVDEKSIKPDWHILEARRESYDPEVARGVPLEVQFVTSGVDFQGDRIEVEHIGWGRGEQSWGLGHHKLYGDPRQPEIYDRLELELQREFSREDRAMLKSEAAGFDTGYAACQRMLYEWLRPRLGRKYFAFKGSSQRDAEPIRHSAQSRVERVRLIMVGTNRIKSYIYNRATIEAVGPGYMHFPASYTIEWFKQLLAEDFTNEVINGNLVRVFAMPQVMDTATDRSARNEALDLRVMNQAALYARGGINWDAQERRNLATIPAEQDPAANIIAQGAVVPVVTSLKPVSAPIKAPKIRRSRGNSLLRALRQGF